MSADRHDQPRPDDVIGEEQERVAAVIYDRLATPSRAYLEVRLHACREYAAERGWHVAAEHIDTGDAALHHRIRPGLSAALEDLRRAAGDPGTDRTVLLVYNDGRLSHDAMNLASWEYHVQLAGGVVITVERMDSLTRRILAERAAREAPGGGAS